MTNVDRRSFLTFAGAAFGSAGMPEWLARAFGPQGRADDWRARQLLTALATAKEHGKPLLVFVVPPAEQAQAGHARGQWLGAWLNHAGAPALHEVGTCVLACATLAEVAAASGAAPVDGAPWMLLLDPAASEGAKPTVTSIVLELPPIALPYAHANAEQYEKASKAHAEAGFATLTKELTAGLHRHGASLARRAERAEATLRADERAALVRWVAGDREASDALVARATAVLLRAIAGLPDAEREPASAALTAAIETAVVRKRVPGARWQVPGGCGATFEDPTPAEKRLAGMIGCGMGVVPAHCERFLNFYSSGA